MSEYCQDCKHMSTVNFTIGDKLCKIHKCNLTGEPAYLDETCENYKKAEGQ